MNAKHTPGPWHAKHEQPHKDRAGTTWYPGTTVEPCGFHLARVGGNNAEDAANARLIAAAPDLLAALESLRAEFPAMGTDDPISGADAVDSLCRIWPGVEAALAKAKGK